MAAIYDFETGYAIAEGLNGAATCDEAINMAREIAQERDEPVELLDDDGHWVVFPSGKMKKIA